MSINNIIGGPGKINGSGGPEGTSPARAAQATQKLAGLKGKNLDDASPDTLTSLGMTSVVRKMTA